MEKKLIQSVLRAIEILDTVSENKEGISLKEIAGKLNLGSSTVFYLINTLVEKDFIKHLKNNKYKLGSKNLQLGNCFLENLSIHKIAMPLIENLMEKINENIHLFIIEDNNFIEIAKIQCSHSVRPTKVSNFRFNSHATAIGKSMLASFNKEELEDFITKYCNLPKLTDNTITNIEQLNEEINRVRKNGYALDIEESEIGLNCIAVPIHNHNKKIIGSLGVSIPTQRFSESIKDKLILELKKTSEAISNELGYKP